MKLYEIGQQIRKLRKEQGITQEELAQKAGISRITIGKLERGQIGSISIKTLDIILDTLGYEMKMHKKLEGSFGLPILE